MNETEGNYKGKKRMYVFLSFQGSNYNNSNNYYDPD